MIGWLGLVLCFLQKAVARPEACYDDDRCQTTKGYYVAYERNTTSRQTEGDALHSLCGTDMIISPALRSLDAAIFLVKPGYIREGIEARKAAFAPHQRHVRD